VTPEEYERWLTIRTAERGRMAAEQFRKPPAERYVHTDDRLADLLDNLAAIAEREAGREA